MEISSISSLEQFRDLVWQTFANISLTYDLVSTQNITKGSNDDANYSYENPAKLGIITGLFIACLADVRIATPKLDVNLDLNVKSTTSTFLNIAAIVLFAPIVLPILILFFVYRKIVELALKLILKDEFMGLFEGTDCVWGLEERTALSVINALGIIEKHERMTDEEFLADFQNLIEKRLVSSNFEKLSWTRERRFGYSYWRKSERKINVEEHVRWMDDHEKCDGSCYKIGGNSMNEILTNLSNRELPRGHSTCWEILVGRDCSKSCWRDQEKMKNGVVEPKTERMRSKSMIPVLFRIHHCVGDGVALLRLLLESVADSKVLTTIEESKEEERELRVPRLRQSFSAPGVVNDDKEMLYSEEYLLTACMPFSTSIPLCTIVHKISDYLEKLLRVLENFMHRDMRENTIKMIEDSWSPIQIDVLMEKARTKFSNILQISSVVAAIPNCLLRQALKSLDNSALHGPPLSGKKFQSCWMETEFESPNLLAKIRDIKDATGSRFPDVVLAALSDNLHRYYLKIGEAAPKTMTVVIPARMTAPNKKLTLRNDFSVGLLTLCCSEVNGYTSSIVTSKETRLFERVSDVASASEKLRDDPDYLINFWVMKWLSAILPEYFLRPVLESHSTLIFSNLPGPQEVTINGCKLKNVSFWIPHRGKTGLGCALLTYGGKVHFSISADAALIRTQSMLDEIVRNTIEDIERLWDSISLSCLTTRI